LIIFYSVLGFTLLFYLVLGFYWFLVLGFSLDFYLLIIGLQLRLLGGRINLIGLGIPLAHPLGSGSIPHIVLQDQVLTTLLVAPADLLLGELRASHLDLGLHDLLRLLNRLLRFRLRQLLGLGLSSLGGLISLPGCLPLLIGCSLLGGLLLVAQLGLGCLRSLGLHRARVRVLGLGLPGCIGAVDITGTNRVHLLDTILLGQLHQLGPILRSLDLGPEDCRDSSLAGHAHHLLPLSRIELITLRDKLEDGQDDLVAEVDEAILRDRATGLPLGLRLLGLGLRALQEAQEAIHEGPLLILIQEVLGLAQELIDADSSRHLA
jgi:hypothetical protein